MNDKRKIAHNVVEPAKFTEVICIGCNEKFTPVEGGDPICLDCFTDITQANQPTIILPLKGEDKNNRVISTIISHGPTPTATIIPEPGEDKTVKS